MDISATSTFVPTSQGRGLPAMDRDRDIFKVKMKY